MTVTTRPAPVKSAKSAKPTKSLGQQIRERVAAYDWDATLKVLDSEGWALLPKLLSSRECESLVATYPHEELFRSKIVMGRLGFGRGEYKYYDYPLPPLTDELRHAFYPYVATIANGWLERLGKPPIYPKTQAEFLEICREDGQVKSTMTILEYGPGDYNCLHQDIHGTHVFPMQVAVLLDQPGQDFTGGQFLMSEHRPRQQTRGIVVEPLNKGDGVLFTANKRPVRGSKGEYQVNMRHGVNRLLWGRRHTLGIIFHDAA